jgi:excisionase family DNA binding protein
MEEKIMTIPEVAEFLKMSKSKVYGLAKMGKIPTVKIGKNVRGKESEFVKWINRNSFQ